MDKNEAYETARSLVLAGNEHLIEVVITKKENLDYVKQRLRTDLATTGDAKILSDVEGPYWYDNEYFPEAKNWPAYYDLLKRKPGWGKKIANGIDEVTSQILNQMPNPKKEEFDCHGLVVGYVQSGKTANYTGLIAKAVDSGYNLVIVFAGLHNNLRKQTQDRLDRELTGEASDGLCRERPPAKHRWTVLTTEDEGGDFYGTTHQNILQHESPILMVVKKNCDVLRRLEEWLTTADDEYLKSKKVLIIDDEADHGSVNTGRAEDKEDQEYDLNKGDLDPSETNRLERVIRNFFTSYAFVGYTATPFANVLTSPFEKDEYGKSLYPSDFIVSLPKPENYIGASELFPDNPDEDEDSNKISIIPEVDAHVINNGGRPWEYDDNYGIPSSLIDAMADFVLTGVVKQIRLQKPHHHSMLVHTSRLCDIQAQIHLRVKEIWKHWKHELEYPSKHSENNDIHALLEKRWVEEFGDSDENWVDIEPQLSSFAKMVDVRVINSESDDLLDYDRYSGSGMKTIVIGGDRLSRGLTLEGLTVSYYTRESKLYDSLLQMSRWYGFRPGYEDLMRIHMTSVLNDSFRWLATVEDSIRSDIARYEESDRSPMTLAVRVLTHASLTPTGKIKPGTTINTRSSWSAIPAETLHFHFNNPNKLQENMDLTGRFVYSLEDGDASRPDLGKKPSLWKGIPYHEITDFLKNYNYCKGQGVFDTKSIIKYIHTQVEKYEELTTWSVYFANSSRAKNHLDLGPVKIGLPRRGRIRGKNRIGRLPNPFDYSIDLPNHPTAYQDDVTKKHDLNKMLRQRNKENGLMIIYILDKDSESWIKNKNKGKRSETVPLFAENEEAVHTVALSVVFPASEKAEKANYIHVKGVASE